jgi:hypothetical protein
MSGWLPTEIVLGDYPILVWPGLIPDATVRWMHFGDKRLSEPFFRQSVEQLREVDRSWEIETSIDTLTREGTSNTAFLPAGFIFHMSRCGSTLISNALKTIDGSQVVSEALAITRLFMPCRPPAKINLADNEERRKIGECLFNIFSGYRITGPEPIVIKFSSQNSICLPIIRNLWPSVPCLFVIRNPIEVMVSNFRGSALTNINQLPETAYDLCGADISRPLTEISIEDFGARVLGRYLDAAIGEAGPMVRIIDYADITPKSMCAIIEFFSLNQRSHCRSFDQVFRHYSKDVAGNVAFYGDRRQKIESASQAILDAVDRWVLPKYKRLTAESRWIFRG